MLQHRADAEPVDLLLLNASNFPGNAVFPYAFVQVSALARTCGLRVARLDLLGVPPHEWRQTISEALAFYVPRSIGVHLRQADSQFVSAYLPSQSASDRYHPIDDTVLLIEIIRGLSDVPVVAGGFGFSLHPERLFDLLKPDFGVVGEPDALFRQFDEVLERGPRDSIPNLIYRDSGELRRTRRVFLPPLQEPEYDDPILADLFRFYAGTRRSVAVGHAAEVDVPVEIMRGCPCRCYFCTEPAVKGRQIRTRNLDAVMVDVDFLARNGVRGFWFVCSELNMAGMEYPLTLAEHMIRFNETREGPPVTWTAYAMPNPGMTRSQLSVLLRSGYIPGCNEIVSLDDTNLKATKMPYRADDAIGFVRDIHELGQLDANPIGGPPLRLDLFLGNNRADCQAVSETLRRFDRENLRELFPWSSTIRATRLYEMHRSEHGVAESTAFSVTRAGRVDVDFVNPTFAYSPAIARELGTEAEVDRFFTFVQDTFLSRRHELDFDVARWLVASVSPEDLASVFRSSPFAAFCCSLIETAKGNTSTDRRVSEATRLSAEQLLNSPTSSSVHECYAAASTGVASQLAALRLAAEIVTRLNAPSFDTVLRRVGCGVDERAGEELTRYRLMEALYSRYDSIEEVVDDALDGETRTTRPVDWFHLMLFLNEKNVQIVPAYRRLLFGVRDAAAVESAASI